MVPSIVTCDHCGAQAAVVSTERIYEHAEHVGDGAADNGPHEYSCKIDCPTCGSRTQVVRAATH
jgi:hypothetical protein